MENTLTLIAAEVGLLDLALIDGVRDALFRLGAEVGRPDWLAADRACDIAFGDLNTDQADAAARSVIGEHAIDVVAQPAAGRRKQLLVADMESTLIRNEMLDELAEFVGLGAEIATVTARAMNGELDFEAALDARVALLAGLPAATLDEAATRITEMPGARQLIATMRHHGAYTAIVSGGFRFFTSKVRAQLGLDIDFANDLLIEDGVLTGAVARPILGRQAKYDTLVQLATAHGLPLSATLSVGDGANDLDMILAAGLGIAFHAKPAVAARAKWRIEDCDLTALLYVQGYRDTAFAP
jgi:phosphoserine phosphatase